jgi:hypothetical protein
MRGGKNKQTAFSYLEKAVYANLMQIGKMPFRFSLFTMAPQTMVRGVQNVEVSLHVLHEK